MKLSYNWLKEITGTNKTPQEIGDMLTMLGLELEELLDYNQIYKGFITAKVVEKNPHPDADKLSLCKVEYNKNSQVVVCGAPNVDAGQTIVLGLEGAVVPSAGFKLSKRKIRGVESNGMICSKAELELGEDHDGIWVLPEDAPIGIPLSEYVGLDDVMIDVFITPNRADCTSHFGIAREIARMEGISIKRELPKLDLGNEEIEIIIENEENCPRYSGLVLKNIEVKESPDWLKNRLKVIGLRPRNLIVDATNYVMMETGNPLHAFDLDKLAGGKIIVKNAENGYKFKSLDEKERILDSEMLTICDSEKPVAIAGVMGGFNSEIDDSTRNILIESAYFNPSSVRKTSRKLSLQSDSSYRYERGVDIDNLEYAALRCAEIILENAGGEITSKYVDNYIKNKELSFIDVRFDRVRKIIGIDISDSEIKEICNRFEFTYKDIEGGLSIKQQSFRFDLNHEIDFIEEIARVYGYDNIQANFVSNIDMSGEPLPDSLKMPNLRQKIRAFLVSKGLIETYSQNQIDEASNSLFNIEAVEIANPLGAELGFMRTSILSPMLKIVSRNINLKNNDLQIFQIGNTYQKDNSKGFIENISETEHLSIALLGKKHPKMWDSSSRDYDFYDLKGIAEDLLLNLGISGVKFKANNELNEFSADSLDIFLKKIKIGSFGYTSKKLKKHFDIDKDILALDINLSHLYKLDIKDKKYQKVSQFPLVERDFAFLIDTEIKAEAILNLASQNAGKYYKDSYIFDVYQGKGIEEGKKSLAFKVIFGAEDKTLTDEEIKVSSDKIIDALSKKYKATLRN